MSANPNLWVLLGLGIAGILIMTRKLRRVVREDFGAFVERFELLPPPQPAPPKAPHPLTGLTFAVADVFDIDGYVTGFGNPDWARTHEAAMHTASLVATLIDGGATCVGKTVTDDMAFSLSGENKYLGTPTNPKDPDRVPGGCSSGSAVVVAGGIVDFALGMDTIGGVRVPGAFCGVLAFRPSHDSILKNGVLQVSPSLDVPGLFAKDTSVLRRVAHVLLKLPYADARPPRRVLIADDYFQLMKDSSKRTIEVVTKTVEALYGRQCLSHVNVGEYLASKIPSLKKLQVSNVSSDLKISSLTSLTRAMRLIHKHEFRSNYENWINSAKPTISSCVSNNLSTSADENDISINYCQTARREAQLAVYSLLKDDGILILPTVSGPPPKLNSKEILSEDYQTCLLNLSAISSMSGCCQITIPLRFREKVPLSVSLIARHGGDRFLLDTVQKMFSVLQEQADLALKPAQSVSASKEESAEIAKEKGNNAYKEKQWQKAISLYTEAIKLNGQNATYYSNRAAAYLEMGSYLQAEGDCNTAINLDKKNVKAFLRRGTAREMLGYYKEAMEDFRYALVLEPTNKTASSAANRLKKFIP